MAHIAPVKEIARPARRRARHAFAWPEKDTGVIPELRNDDGTESGEKPQAFASK
jgi:hypothetical protein